MIRRLTLALALCGLALAPARAAPVAGFGYEFTVVPGITLTGDLPQAFLIATVTGDISSARLGSDMSVVPLATPVIESEEDNDYGTGTYVAELYAIFQPGQFGPVPSTVTVTMLLFGYQDPSDIIGVPLQFQANFAVTPTIVSLLPVLGVSAKGLSFDPVDLAPGRRIKGVVQWGDGTVSLETLSAGDDGAVVLPVDRHRYAAPGVYDLTLSYTLDGQTYAVSSPVEVPAAVPAPGGLLPAFILAGLLAFRPWQAAGRRGG